ncbi:hypothetical protein [Pinibacter aurantiacus]|uniref:Uncharacterized protein n=1 Tax=Pinibacter aurantiacus TaxID=2851599 RepID=A0A9E2SA78_9BACT|nr:hypothetical protein [Pinibacter aurantiacus]MBV4357592.1 hypothetical protein [Pinibacter aurantiacus]
MKMLYLAAIFSVCWAHYYSARGQNFSRNITTGIAQDTSLPAQNKSNPYAGLRHLALSVTPEKLHLSLPVDQTIVYGVLMDMDMGTGFGSFASFQTGDASFYLSNGSGIMGGVTDQNVRDAAKKFVATAQTYIDKTSKTEYTPLPRKNYVGFYFLTNKGLFFADEKLDNIGTAASIWAPLIDAGNKVANELIKSKKK